MSEEMLTPEEERELLDRQAEVLEMMIARHEAAAAQAEKDYKPPYRPKADGGEGRDSPLRSGPRFNEAMNETIRHSLLEKRYGIRRNEEGNNRPSLRPTRKDDGG